METKARSIAKAISWRVIATLVTMTVVYLVTGRVGAAVEIGLFDTLIKIFAYFWHERIWLRVPYGQKRYTDYQI